MGLNKKAKPKRPIWQRVMMLVGSVVIVLGLVFVLLYFTNRPNYRDLQKEYERVSTFIPADWELVSESNNKGTWGLFCLDVGDDTPCPTLEKLHNSKSSIDPDEDKKIVQSLLNNANYVIANTRWSKCTLDIVSSEKYFCYAEGSKDNIALLISISKNPDSNLKELTIILESSSAAGL